MSEQKTISKLAENKFFIHIFCESVAFLGLAFYVSGKNKKLTAHIEQLNQRLEQTDTQLQKLDSFCQQISPLLAAVNQRIASLENNQSSVRETMRETPVKSLRKKEPLPQGKKSVTFSQKVQPAKVSTLSSLPTIKEMKDEEEDKPEENTEEDSENEEELDKDLEDELQELNTDDSLKKTL